MRKGIVIDFSKPKGYKTKDWLAMEKLQKDNLKNIIRWKSSGGENFYEVKNKKLLLGGKIITKQKGHGLLGKGQTFYKVREKGYYRDLGSSQGQFIEGYLKGILRPFNIKNKK